MLIVLDQLDLHPGVSRFLHDLMQQARRVRLLITSSNRLDLPGEWVLPLYGLSVPETDDPDEVRRSEAVQLFMQAVLRVCGVCGIAADQLSTWRTSAALWRACLWALSWLPPGRGSYPIRRSPGKSRTIITSSRRPAQARPKGTSA